MTDKYAIFLDVDGTLAFPDNFPFGGKVSAENARVIKAVRELGHYVFINTGRAYGWIPKPVLNGAEYDGVVSGIGTSIIFRGESLFEDFVDRKTLRRVLEEVLPAGKTVMFGGMENVFVANPDGEWDSPEFIKITAADDFDKKYPNANIQKVEIFASEITDSQRKLFEDNFSVYYHSFYVEGWNRGNSKAGGMKMAAEKLGVKIENCIAVGDSVNDIDVMTAAGISVAMGNASDEVKSIATIVTDTCENDGVAKALERLILNK
ncbi:MAG: HAD-IIB family hydrolase [Clostridia bacterium]|nr:HAD-IIB family hydrolase [Clostridia bacterium]